MITEVSVKRLTVSIALDFSQAGKTGPGFQKAIGFTCRAYPTQLIVVIVVASRFQRSQEEIEYPREPRQTQDSQNPGALFKTRGLVRSSDNPYR